MSDFKSFMAKVIGEADKSVAIPAYNYKTLKESLTRLRFRKILGSKTNAVSCRQEWEFDYNSLNTYPDAGINLWLSYCSELMERINYEALRYDSRVRSCLEKDRRVLSSCEEAYLSVVCRSGILSPAWKLPMHIGENSIHSDRAVINLSFTIAEKNPGQPFLDYLLEVGRAVSYGYPTRTHTIPYYSESLNAIPLQEKKIGQ